jgi:hypothetical protein
MQRHRVCAIVGVSLLCAGSVFAQGAQQPQIRPETFYPRHAGRGQTTVINLAVPSPAPAQTAEVSPPDGVTVSGIKGSGSGSEQNIGWWEISLDVAKDAMPGDRSLVLVLQRGRTMPVTITIPTHVPTISNLRIAPPRGSQQTAELELAIVDAAGDLGADPYVWLTADCGEEPIVGALPTTVGAGIVRASLPTLTGKCDLQVRVTDSIGIESNTLKTAVELTK